MLCHGTVCVVGKMRDLILQLSKSSIYSTKPFYTHSGQSIRKPADKTAMKQAVERHKKRWRLA
ncbi:hypothetical protein [Klebsiella variicola]|uniref:hypothetical protein n=1 Tax=Klebsiella variicola TaxID=244366 RepID=UPI0034DEDD5D